MPKHGDLSLAELNAVVLDLESKALAEADRLQVYYKSRIDSGEVTDFEIDGYEACFILKAQSGSDEDVEEIEIDVSWHNIEIQDPISGLTKTLLALFKKLEIFSKHDQEELVRRVTRVWLDVKSRAQFMHEIEL